MITCNYISSSNYDYQGSSFSQLRLLYVNWGLKILCGGADSSEKVPQVELDVKP